MTEPLFPRPMRRLLWIGLLCSSLACHSGPRLVSFPSGDGGFIYGDVYGKGERGVVLAHGARFDRSSWAEQAQRIAAAGFRCLAIDFRGRGHSYGGKELIEPEDLAYDVLAAVRYLHRGGVESVSVVGASFGGWAAANAAIAADPGEIDRLVLLAASPVEEPERLPGRKLFILARDDSRGEGVPRLPDIRLQYERAPAPKELVLLEGEAHAQLLFDTEQGEQLLAEIVRFLLAP